MIYPVDSVINLLNNWGLVDVHCSKHLWLSSLLRHVSVAGGAKSQQNHWTSLNLWGDFIQRRHKGPGAGDFPRQP